MAATSKPVSNEQRFEETLRRFSSPIERVSETYEVMIKGTVVEYGESDVVEPKVSGPPSSSPQATSRPSTQPPTRESSRLDRRGQQPDDKHHGVHGGSHSRSSSRTSRHSSLSSSSSNSSSSRAVSEDGKGSGQRGKRSSRSGAHGKQHHGRFTYKKLRKSVLGWFSLGDSQKREADTHDSDDDSTPQRSVPSLRESTSEVAPFALSGEVDVFFRCTRESEFMALTEEWAKHTAVSDALDESTENEHSLELAEFSASVTPPPTDRWLNYLHYDVDPHNGLRFAVFPPYLWHEFLSIAPSVLYHVARGMLVVESVVPSQSTGDALLSPICTSKHAEVPQLTVTNAEGISAPARYPSLSPPCAASASSMGSVRGGESPGLVRKQGALTGAGSSFGSPSPAAASWDTVNLVATSSAPRRDSAAEDLSAVTSPQHTRFRDCFLCLAESHLLFFNSFAELKLHFRLDSVETMLYSSSEDGFPSDPFCCFKTKAGEDELEEPALWLTFTFMPWAPRSEDPSSDVEETPAVGHSLSGDKDGSMEAQGSPQHRQSLIQRQESFLHAFQTVMPRQMKQVPLHELLRGSTPKSPHPPSHPPHTSHGAASAPLAVTEHTHSHTTVPHVHHHLLHKRPICPPMLHASALTGKGPYDKEKPTLLVEVKRTDLQEVVTDEPSSGHHHHRHRPLRHRFLCTRLSPSTGVAADSHQPASVPCTGDMSNAWRRMVLPVAGWDFNDPPEDVSASTNVALSLRMAMSRPAILAQKSDLFMSPIRTPKSMQSFAFVSGDRAVTSPDGNSGAAAETDVKPSAPRPPPAAKSGALKGPKVIVPRSKAAVDTQTDPVAADTASAGDEMVQNGSMVFAARKPQKKKSKLVRRRQV